MQRYFFASDHSSGRSDCPFHHCSGLSLRGNGLRSLYLITSCCCFHFEGFSKQLVQRSTFFFFLQGGWSSSENEKNTIITGLVCNDLNFLFFCFILYMKLNLLTPYSQKHTFLCILHLGTNYVAQIALARVRQQICLPFNSLDWLSLIVCM